MGPLVCERNRGTSNLWGKQVQKHKYDADLGVMCHQEDETLSANVTSHQTVL